MEALVEDSDEDDSVEVLEWWEEDHNAPNGGRWRTTMVEQGVEGEESDEDRDEVEIIYEMITID